MEGVVVVVRSLPEGALPLGWPSDEDEAIGAGAFPPEQMAS